MDHGYHYTYEYNYPIRNGDERVFAAIMSIYLIIIAVIVIFALISYIFHSIAIYTIGKRMGKEYPWLAFIPYARDYFQGALAGEIVLKNKKISNPGIWNLIVPIISSVLGGVFLVIMLFVASFSAATEAAGFGGLGIAVALSTLLYTVMLVAVVALSAAQLVLTVLINKQILERFTTGNMAIIHAALTITVPLYEAFCLFVMRNKEFNPGMEPKLTPPPVQSADREQWTPPVQSVGREQWTPPVQPVDLVPPIPPAAPEEAEPNDPAEPDLQDQAPARQIEEKDDPQKIE